MSKFLKNSKFLLSTAIAHSNQLFGADSRLMLVIVYSADLFFCTPYLQQCRVPFTMISRISTMVNGTLLNFGKRYEDDLRVIFEQWPKLHLGLDQQTLKGI